MDNRAVVIASDGHLCVTAQNKSVDSRDFEPVVDRAPFETREFKQKAWDKAHAAEQLQLKAGKKVLKPVTREDIAFYNVTLDEDAYNAAFAEESRIEEARFRVAISELLLGFTSEVDIALAA